MKVNCVQLAEKFVEHCKNGNIHNKPFVFKVDNGNTFHIFGTILIDEFDSLLFVTSIYGDEAGVSVSTFSPVEYGCDFKRLDESDWKIFYESAAEYFCKNYGGFSGEFIV